MNLVQNKVALVTACTRGIGKAAVKALAENGAKVYMGVRNLEQGEAIAKEIGAAGVVHFNPEFPETCAGCVKELLEKEGRIDILVNNYVGGKIEADIDVASGDMEGMMYSVNLNMTTNLSITQAALPAMMAQGSGSIIFMSSTQSLRPDTQRPSFCISKAAVNSLVQNISCQYGKYNIRCNAILPGLTMTDAAIQGMPKEWLDMYSNVIPMVRSSTPEDIANAVLFFASEMSAHVSGQLLAVDGGCVVANPMYGLYPFMKPPAKE